MPYDLQQGRGRLRRLPPGIADSLVFYEISRWFMRFRFPRISFPSAKPTPTPPPFIRSTAERRGDKQNSERERESERDRVVTEVTGSWSAGRAKKEQLERVSGLLPESQGQNLALTVLLVPPFIRSASQRQGINLNGSEDPPPPLTLSYPLGGTVSSTLHPNPNPQPQISHSS